MLGSNKCSIMQQLLLSSNLHYSTRVICREEYSQILVMVLGHRWHLLIVQMEKVKQSI